MLRHCKVTECKKNYGGLCGEASCSNPDLFREVTDKCPLCQQNMKTHPACAACGILVGLGHLEVGLVTYQYHQVCPWCKKRWGERETVLRRAVPFEEYCRPDLGKK